MDQHITSTPHQITSRLDWVVHLSLPFWCIFDMWPEQQSSFWHADILNPAMLAKLMRGRVTSGCCHKIFVTGRAIMEQPIQARASVFDFPFSGFTSMSECIVQYVQPAQIDVDKRLPHIILHLLLDYFKYFQIHGWPVCRDLDKILDSDLRNKVIHFLSDVLNWWMAHKLWTDVFSFHRAPVP